MPIQATFGRPERNPRSHGACAYCGEVLLPGQRVIQIWLGVSHSPFVTPTYSSRAQIALEAHVGCFPSDLVRWQRQPYLCDLCDRTVSGQEAIFGAEGDKPSHRFIRPERRGHELCLARHCACDAVALRPVMPPAERHVA